MLVGVAQGVALVSETMLAGTLGTGALAAYALVLPFALLMAFMSTGAMGGGVSSAVARALGAGRRREAAALVGHALLIGGGLGLAFALAMALAGDRLFAALGAGGELREAAADYARLLFIGVPFHWLTATLASVLRGAGVMDLPARVIIGAWLAEPVLAALLVLGPGPLPELGLAGIAVAYAVVFSVATVVLLRAVLGGACGFRPALRGRLRLRLFRRILAVGAVASVMATLAVLTGIVVTRLMAGHGAAAIAGWGIAARLEFLMVPLAFGVGATLTQRVGRLVGARRWDDARRLAWRGALAVALGSGFIGLAVAAWPQGWVWLFTDDPDVARVAAQALRTIGPAYAALGLGMALYFASQGAGRMGRPFAAAVLRVACAAGGGALAGPMEWGLQGIFAAVAAGLVGYALVLASGVRRGLWRASA